MPNLPFLEEILADLRRFKECVEDGQDVDLGRDRFDLLTQLGLLERTQRSPALWVMTQAGEDAIAQPAAGEPVYQWKADGGWIESSERGIRIAKENGHQTRVLWTAPPAAAHGDEASPWLRFDKSAPPEPGRYLVWDECLPDPSAPLLWTFRPIDLGGRRSGPGKLTWFNEGNWPADRAPSHYAPLTTPLAAMRAQGDGEVKP